MAEVDATRTDVCRYEYGASFECASAELYKFNNTSYMKSCGGCTLCCKLEKIPQLDKPRWVLCQFCVEGQGCTIYEDRPKPCRTLICGWLSSDKMTEEMRPDRAHLYIARIDDETANIMVDPDHPDAWKNGAGKDVVEHVRTTGRHAIVVVGNQVTFLGGHCVLQPERLLLDWEL